MSYRLNNYFTNRFDVRNFLTRRGIFLNLTFSDHLVRTSGTRLWNSLANSHKIFEVR